MPYYIQRGSTYTVSDNADLLISETLPHGNYTVGFDQMRGEFYLQQVDDFTLPAKLYGDTPKLTERILRTYADRPRSTGVLLAGEKGSGKTLLAKTLAVQGGMPTLVINQSWSGDGFNRFIQQIEQPCVVLFDEFEKVYSEKDDQEALLTLLDGVFPTRKLFVFTCNNRWKLDANLMNRPGRIFYLLDFHGVNAEFIREYCADHLHTADHTESLVQVAATFGEFNFDLLQAAVEEMNRYQENAWDVVRFLNAKPESAEEVEYDVTLTVNGTVEKSIYPQRLDVNPIKERRMVVHSYDEEGDSTAHQFHLSDLIALDGPAGEFRYQKNGSTLLLKKRKPEAFDLRRFMAD